MGYLVPMQDCLACLRETIVGDSPAWLLEFKICEPDQLVFHLREPQASQLVAFRGNGFDRRGLYTLLSK